MRIAFGSFGSTTVGRAGATLSLAVPMVELGAMTDGLFSSFALRSAGAFKTTRAIAATAVALFATGAPVRSTTVIFAPVGSAGVLDGVAGRAAEPEEGLRLPLIAPAMLLSACPRNDLPSEMPIRRGLSRKATILSGLNLTSITAASRSASVVTATSTSFLFSLKKMYARCCTPSRLELVCTSGFQPFSDKYASRITLMNEASPARGAKS